ncbi:MAG: ribbon-helix-helix protein, CopG family [Anaerolineae bacterium]|nr:ribbon-helix-helix protein, CopG family [Anaerolineae bacterium]
MFIRTQVLFDEETLHKLKAAAKEQKRSVSDLVRQLVESGLERQRQEELRRFEELLAELRQIRESNAATYGAPPPDLLQKVREERARELEELWKLSS